MCVCVCVCVCLGFPCQVMTSFGSPTRCAHVNILKSDTAGVNAPID